MKPAKKKVSSHDLFVSKGGTQEQKPVWATEPGNLGNHWEDMTRLSWLKGIPDSKLMDCDQVNNLRYDHDPTNWVSWNSKAALPSTHHFHTLILLHPPRQKSLGQTWPNQNQGQIIGEQKNELQPVSHMAWA